MLQASTSFVPRGSTTPVDRMGIADYFPVGYIQPTIRGSKRRVVVRVFVPVGRRLSSIAQPTIYRDLPRNYPDGEYKLAASAR
jgi:hypothetical protein